MIKKIDSTFIFIIVVIAILIAFSIVPNSFGISIIGCGVTFLWLIFRVQNELLASRQLRSDEAGGSTWTLAQRASTSDRKALAAPDGAKRQRSINHLFEMSRERVFLGGLSAWLLLLSIAACLCAWARFISPGFDLYWFSQAVTNAKIGYGLHISSERIIPSLLVQHWEPILYTVVPFTFLFSGAVSAVLWQALGLCGGTWGAFKLCSFLFRNHTLKYLLVILFVVGWVTINPISFDIHPPVFGTLLFIPWIVYFILSGKSRVVVLLLLLLLMQCGEMFFAIVPAYFVYLFLEKKINIYKIILSVLIYASGFFLIGFYQKFVGPYWSGLPFKFASRYSTIGGDGIGILNTFLHHPIFVISQLFMIAKVKTFAKIFIYYGFLPVFALRSKKYRLLVICLWLGCLPYFIQVGLTDDKAMLNTNMQYISSLGAQWWVLSVLGVYTILQQKNSIARKLLQKHLLVPCFLILFFLNSSEWRKSPLYPIRGLIEREHADAEVRSYLTTLPKDKGILFLGAEWLCPLAADERYNILCENGDDTVFQSMPLDVIVGQKDVMKEYYLHLSEESKNSKNGIVLAQILRENFQEIGWEEKFEKRQSKLKETPVEYYVWKYSEG